MWKAMLNDLKSPLMGLKAAMTLKRRIGASEMTPEESMMKTIPSSAPILIRRIKWKRPPNEDEYDLLKELTPFGPSCFEKGNEWLFIFSDSLYYHADTPDGYTRIN